MSDAEFAPSEGHLGYAVLFEEQITWDGYDPEADGELEWEETQMYIGGGDFEDYIKAARRCKAEGCRNVRVVELIESEREVFRP